MPKNSFLPYILTIASLISSNYCLSNQTTQSDSNSAVEHISRRYVNSTFGEEIITAPEPVNDASLTFMERLNKAFDPKTQLLNPREVQQIAFDIVTHSASFTSTVIDTSCIDKLEIVGGGENVQQHLFGHIFKDIQTATGKAYASLLFCHPTTNIETLQKRQNVINFLSNANTHAVEHALTNIENNEEKSLMFWHTKSPANQELLKTFYFGQSFDYNNILKSFNTDTASLEITNRTLQMLSLACGTLYLPATLVWQIHDYAKMTGTSFVTVLNSFKSEFAEAPLHYKAIIALPIAAQSCMAFGTFKGLQTTNEICKHLQNILIGTSTTIKELQTLSSFVNKNKTLLNNLPSLQPLADFNNSAKRSAKLNKLLAMLNTNTFSGQASICSLTGRVLAAYELMKQTKDELAPVYTAAGELDTYIAIAKMYKAHQEKSAHYCMVNFIENNATPVIIAQNFWNPFVDADKVITNNITFNHLCPNSILTGPNTGGKSTILKAIIINILMAQTFGIAPAESLTITAFSKLNCFMNISDDIAMGASLFKSEVKRAKKLLNTVQSLPKNEFSFIIIDEVFTGTSPKEGEIAAMQFSQHLGSYPNNISIIATHYPKMTELESTSNGLFYNHHVEILRNEDNSLNRTFKLKNGPSFCNVAADILKEEGLFI